MARGMRVRITPGVYRTPGRSTSGETGPRRVEYTEGPKEDLSDPWITLSKRLRVSYYQGIPFVWYNRLHDPVYRTVG